jgi:hypothetical protein
MRGNDETPLVSPDAKAFLAAGEDVSMIGGILFENSRTNSAFLCSMEWVHLIVRPFIVSSFCEFGLQNTIKALPPLVGWSKLSSSAPPLILGIYRTVRFVCSHAG